MATKNHMSLPNHYEQHLGEIDRGLIDEKRMHGIQVVSFDGQPEVGVRTFATLGLSRHIVDLSGARQIRQERLMSANETFSSGAVAGLVLSLAEHVLQRGKALLRGEVIGPWKLVVAGSTLTEIYVTNPSPFDSSLTEFVSELPASVFAYLIPITQAEAALVRERVWNWFEDELERQNPDIWDLVRTESLKVASP